MEESPDNLRVLVSVNDARAVCEVAEMVRYFEAMALDFAGDRTQLWRLCNFRWVCHSPHLPAEAPFYFPRILRYVSVDSQCKKRIQAVPEIPATRIEVVPNAVDLTRISTTFSFGFEAETCSGFQRLGEWPEPLVSNSGCLPGYRIGP
jgi:hypothetical protein